LVKLVVGARSYIVGRIMILSKTNYLFTFEKTVATTVAVISNFQCRNQ